MYTGTNLSIALGKWIFSRGTKDDGKMDKGRHTCLVAKAAAVRVGKSVFLLCHVFYTGTRLPHFAILEIYDKKEYDQKCKIPCMRSNASSLVLFHGCTASHLAHWALVIN